MLYNSCPEKRKLHAENERATVTVPKKNSLWSAFRCLARPRSWSLWRMRDHPTRALLVAEKTALWSVGPSERTVCPESRSSELELLVSGYLTPSNSSVAGWESYLRGLKSECDGVVKSLLVVFGVRPPRPRESRALQIGLPHLPPRHVSPVSLQG